MKILATILFIIESIMVGVPKHDEVIEDFYIISDLNDKSIYHLYHDFDPSYKISLANLVENVGEVYLLGNVLLVSTEINSTNRSYYRLPDYLSEDHSKLLSELTPINEELYQSLIEHRNSKMIFSR